ncbi:MAG: hypothetical protein HFH45_01250 [Bacilli bacterium]|nr:hypothetical protein [Bacilli bacterium]
MFGIGMFAMFGIIVGVIALGMWGFPKYNVWKNQLKGEAQLKEAEYSKQVQIEEAKANLEAEKLNAKAEVERAKGMAEAMEIEGGKLTDEYVKYLWVKTMAGQEKSTIYIPTEASLPLLEAK